jgi:hypothetical protein
MHIYISKVILYFKVLEPSSTLATNKNAFCYVDLRSSTVKMEAVLSSETSVNFYQTTQRQYYKIVLFIATAVRTSDPTSKCVARHLFWKSSPLDLVIKHYAMKAYGEWRYNYTLLNLGTNLNWVVSFAHLPF